MDISSHSSDTIVLTPRSRACIDVNEPSDSEIENILKKYSSTSSSAEFKENFTMENNFNDGGGFFKELNNISPLKNMGESTNEYNVNGFTNRGNDRYKYCSEGDFDENVNSGECSDEDLIVIPPIKRVKKNDGVGGITKPTNQTNKCVKENNIASAENLNKDSESILRELYNKYLPSTSKVHSPERNLIVLSDDSDTNEPSHNFSRCLNQFPYNKPPELQQGRVVDKRNTRDDVSSSSEDESLKKSDKFSMKTVAKRPRTAKTSEKGKKQTEAAKRREMRILEKEKKKEVMEKQKAMKNALKTVQQITKPDECIKLMIVEVALEISQTDYVEDLKETLKSNDISFRATAQALPNLISWCRKIPTIENMLLKNTEVKENHFLLVMDKLEFMRHIRNNSLTVHIQSISSLIKYKQLTIAILGLDRAKGDQDLAVTEAQILTKTYFRFVKENEDLALLVMEVTKAIAQIPHKLKKEEKYKLQTEYFNDTNKDTVVVDKNGNGLGRLWHQMLTMFPLARLETAEAIAAVYPTPVSLFQAYDSCEGKKEELLQDLPIRRAHGPCTSVRRIGPELSKKCCNFFCSHDNVLL